MIITTKGIVIRAIKYSETSLICDIYTEAMGMQPYIVSGVRKRKAKISASLLQVMSIVELVAYHKEGRDINRVTELKPEYVYQKMPFDVIRGAVGLFMTELVQKTVKEHEANPQLFDFLYHAFTNLDSTIQSIANYHLAFMAQLTEYLGFMMEDNYSPSMPYFDVKEGRYRSVRIANQDGLNKEMSEALFAFCQIPLTDSHQIKLSREDRKIMIKRLIRYYQHRIENFKELNAFKVLQEIF
jgi:DNA repair protein RecO (recombination protein O)